ncbi:hypothetical protein ACFWOJ_21825 [Streptomyces sp. NPDC058439]|uniref:hypothetical protein n=1 Tax=Streptomyces sp. NPDC058439 TaxID=3346500 RepID=UPI00364F5E8B
MNRRSLPIATALTATAALLLTACGSGGGKTEANDKIAGVEQSASPSASPSPSADTAGRPKITLPADFKNTFEGWTTGDTTKDALLSDISNAINSVDATIASNEAESPAIPFYHQRDALISTTEWIQKFKNKDLTITGATRYHSPKIQMFGDAAAGVTYCADESKAFSKERKTGTVKRTPATNNSYVTYSIRVDKNQQDVWQTTQITSKRGDKTCTP